MDSEPCARRGDPLLESLKLESQLMKLPLQQIKIITMANHLNFKNKISALLSILSKIGAGDQTSKRPAIALLNDEVTELEKLRLTLVEGRVRIEKQERKCRERLAHLERAREEQELWNSRLVNRIIVDYLSRSSYFETATLLAKEFNIEHLVDIDIFCQAKSVTEKLKIKDVSCALNWCRETNFDPQNSKSMFEFRLRRQEYIELVKDQRKEAAQYFKMYIHPWKDQIENHVELLDSALAFKHKARFPELKELFQLECWDGLIKDFNVEFCTLYGIPVDPLLVIYLQAGLSALKTPFCFENACLPRDPLSNEIFQKLARPLPIMNRSRSQLLCSITGKAISSQNPACALPNGRVYSVEALEEMWKNKGEIVCPKTGMTYRMDQVLVCDLNT